MPKHKRKPKQDREIESFKESQEELQSVTETEMSEASADITNTLAQSLSAMRENVLINDSGVREAVLKIRVDTAHTIAELEAWRDEIDRTIAFLKARR
jgi:hypothetical protein